MKAKIELRGRHKGVPIMNNNAQAQNIVVDVCCAACCPHSVIEKRSGGGQTVYWCAGCGSSKDDPERNMPHLVDWGGKGDGA